MSLPTVLITGASKGIGREIAIDLAKQNKYKIALLSRSVQHLKQTAEQCKDVNPDASILILPCDVTDKTSLKACIDKCALEFGPLSVIINNAGLLYINGIDESIDMNKVADTININLNGAINGCIFSVPHLKKTKQKYQNYQVCVINIASRASVNTTAKFGIYCASKFGLKGFSDCLFKEMVQTGLGIKVCSIMPGYVNTEMMKNNPDYGAFAIDKMIQARDVVYTVNYVLNCPDTCCPTEILVQPQYDVVIKKAQSKL